MSDAAEEVPNTTAAVLSTAEAVLNTTKEVLNATADVLEAAKEVLNATVDVPETTKEVLSTTVGWGTLALFAPNRTFFSTRLKSTRRRIDATRTAGPFVAPKVRSRHGVST